MHRKKLVLVKTQGKHSETEALGYATPSSAFVIPHIFMKTTSIKITNTAVLYFLSKQKYLTKGKIFPWLEALESSFNNHLFNSEIKN